MHIAYRCVFIVAFSLITTKALSSEVQTGASVGVIALDSQGLVMVETELEFVPEWTSIAIGDPLTLEFDRPFSIEDPDREFSVCESGDPEEMAALSYFEAMLRHPRATKACAFPLRPTGSFYWTTFPDGGVVILRLPQNSNPAVVKASYKGQVYELSSAKLVAIARLQMSGKAPDVDLSTLIIEQQIALADCASLIAYHDQQGQAEALEYAAEVVSNIEESFKERTGSYSRTLCQLYKDKSAVVSALPRNPYDFELDLCKTEFSVPRPQGALRYFAEIEAGDESAEHVVGYWLAILGEGPVIEPRKPLPQDYAMPLRAIAWLEHHPEDEDSVSLAAPATEAQDK